MPKEVKMAFLPVKLSPMFKITFFFLLVGANNNCSKLSGLERKSRHYICKYLLAEYTALKPIDVALHVCSSLSRVFV